MEKHLPVECLKQCHFTSLGVDYPEFILKQVLKGWTPPEGMSIDNAWVSGASLVLHCEGCAGAEHLLKAHEANKSAEVFLHEEAVRVFMALSRNALAEVLKAVNGILRLRKTHADEERVLRVEETIGSLKEISISKRGA